VPQNLGVEVFDQWLGACQQNSADSFDTLLIFLRPADVPLQLMVFLVWVGKHL